MSYDTRKEAIISSVTRVEREVTYPRKPDGRPLYPSEIFGEQVFTLKDMAKALPKSIFASFLKQRRGHHSLDKTTANAIAHAVRVWAMDRGATHFTHWFQPQTGSTAEKHDAFLNLISNFIPGGEETTAMDLFSGSQLLQSEPDASSFPSGGMRSTFEARGYTIWDTSSPLFIQPGPNGTSILYVPSVFISYNGEALDEKTVLLRSNEALSRASCELLALIDPAAHTGHVYTTLGTEQEFFLVDRSMYVLRPDLKITGRTLLGNLPPRHQQLEDHYFGKVPTRVMRVMSDLELECLRLGIPLKTRHNEVAPGQFEVAPIFEECSVAVDHNLLTMSILHRVAHRHNLRALFHEKPYKGVNGSGKHCNWSMCTDRGENLLDPTIRPEANYRFLLILLAVMHGVNQYAPLLRLAISSSSNDHRLGAQEAPPAIISIFLGDQLSEVLDAIEENRPIKNFSVPEFKTISVGGTVLDLKVSALPNISRDLTDRNRTSPFAFTGNRFEFRAVGSKQSPSFPVAILNSAVTDAIYDITKDLVAARGDKPHLSEEDRLSVIRKYITLTKPIRFEGDNYSQEWLAEAEKRGLPIVKSTPEAFDLLLDHRYSDMLTKKVRIFSESELTSRHYILNERYAKDLLIEAETLNGMISQLVLPAAFEYRKTLAESAHALSAVSVSNIPELVVLNKLSGLIGDLQDAHTQLVDAIEQYIKVEDEEENSSVHAKLAVETIRPALELVRQKGDEP